MKVRKTRMAGGWKLEVKMRSWVRVQDISIRD